MITLSPITDTQYKIILETDDLTYEDRTKLLRQRDLFPAEFVSTLMKLIPDNQTFDTYDHYNMVLYVK